MNLVDNPLGLLIAYGAGIVVSFTPCVYPLLPITIGYVGAAAGGSRLKGFIITSVYALGIAVTYALLGGFAALTGKVFGEIAGSPWPYFIVANVCMFLGLVFLDVFTLPFGALNLKRVQPKGLISTFVFGMLSGLVVGPCTAPALGTILVYVSTKQNIFYGMLLLFCFAYGVCTTLVLAGTFSSILANLPKSGLWLEKVKKLCGLILLGMGEYFLIQAGKMLL